MKKILLLAIILTILIYPGSALTMYNSTSGGYNITIINGTSGTVQWDFTNIIIKDCLIIGGGGSSGQGNPGLLAASTGGAGGVLNGSLSGQVTGIYNLTVGAGGIAQTSTNTHGYMGGNTSISNLTTNWTAYGGGYGQAGNSVGGNGGSGGGSYSGTNISIQTSQSPLTGYGNSGGTGAGDTAGGGAGGAASGTTAGVGKAFEITGTSITYAKGGIPRQSTSQTKDGFGDGGDNTADAVTSRKGGNGTIILKWTTTEISASFTQSPNPSIVGQPVTFTDFSTGLPVTWSWSPIGGASTNSTQNAVYTYTSPGTYNVFLNVTNATGHWSNTSQTHTVIGKASADFYMPANGTASETIFYDLSPNARTISTFADTKIRNSNSSWRFNNASYFDGTGDMLQASPASLNFGANYPWTVAFWMNSSSATSWNAVVGNMNKSARENGELRIASRTMWGNTVYIGGYYGGDVAIDNRSVNLNDGKWHWVVVERTSATKLDAWSDGSYMGNVTINPAMLFGLPSRNLTIGYLGSDGSYYTGYVDDLIVLNGTAIDGTRVPISEFIGSTAAFPPVASFTVSNSSGIYPPSLTVRFTDTSTNTPTSWEWNATNVTGNNTPFTFATTQNPLWYFDIGNYSISLNATNADGSDVSDQVTWINVSAPTSLSLAEFTGSPLSGNVPLSVTFTDADGTGETAWFWIFGDGNTTGNTLQNPVHLYTASGVYTVNHSATNAIGENWTNKTGYVTVVNASGFTPQDIWMEGQYLQTFRITDSTTGLPISVVDLTLSPGGLTYTTTNGTGYLTSGFGSYYVTFISEGYSGKTISYVFDSDESHLIQLTPVTPGGTKTTFYIPQQVRIKLIDQTGKYLNGVSMTATPLNFTAPVGWLETLIGIDADVNMENTTLLGTTGSDGSWAAPMMASFEYEFTITDASRDIDMTFTTYPSQSEFVWMIPVGFVAIETPSNIITYSLGNVTVNQTQEYINMSYVDSTSGTTSLQFVVYNTTGHLVYSANYTGAANCSSKTFSQLVTHSTAGGDVFTYGIFASQSQYGWINQTQTVTFNNQIALIGAAPGWVEYWLSVGLIIIMGASFGLLARRFALIVVSLLAWFLQFWMGWFDVGAPGAVLFGFLMALGVLIYIRESENKLQ